jgi:hypothetical protein
MAIQLDGSPGMKSTLVRFLIVLCFMFSVMSTSAHAVLVSQFAEAGSSTTDAFAFNASAGTITYTPGQWSSPWVIAGNSINTALLSTTTYTGDFSLTFTMPKLTSGHYNGFFGVSLADATGSTWVTSDLVEEAYYPEWGTAIYRRQQGGYTYTSSGLGPFTFSLSRTGSTVKATINGTSWSNTTTYSGAVRLGIYYYTSSNHVQYPMTLSSSSFFADVPEPASAGLLVLMGAGLLCRRRKALA